MTLRKLIGKTTLDKMTKPVPNKEIHAVNTGVCKKFAFGLGLSVFFFLSGCSSNQVHQTSPATSNYTAVSSVPIASTLTSNATQMGLKPWRDAGYTGKGVTVAVLDTGMPVWDINDRNIPLSANLRYDADYTHDQIVKNSDTSIYNANHGDDMSQVIGSATYGAAPDTNILNGVIADTNGWANRASMIKGIEWSVNHSADIINLSFGYGALVSYTGSAHSNIESELNTIKNQAVTSQVAIVHSAGNDSTSGNRVTVTSKLISQSGYEDWVKSNAKNNILIVGATYDNQTLAYFSNSAGSDSDVQARYVVAPAQSEVTNGYSTLYSIGTSGAAANVSGALAVMKQRWQSLTGVQLEQIIIDTANRSFAGYTAATFGQGIVDLNSAFSPVGKTSVPVASVSASAAAASVPLSSAVVTLPAGFKTVNASTAFLDSYGRDFTLNYETPVQTYQSGLDKTVRSYVDAPVNYRQQLSTSLQLGFSMTGTHSNERQDSGLWFLGMASGYQQNLNTSVLGQISLTGHFSDMSVGMSATAPNPNQTNVSSNVQTEPAVQGMKASLGFKGLSIMPYWLASNNTSAFTGAQTETLSGVQTEYHHHGWLAGLDWSRQTQPGQSLIQNYNIDSQKYYAGYRAQLNPHWRVGLLGFWQNDSAHIGYQHPQSVGDGSLRYVTDNLTSNRSISGVSAALSVGHLQAAFLSSNLDQELFLGFKHAFN
ncbi:S8 family peptidase [Hydrogenovibrio marinus]|uniref:Peptidase S8/S53 domain-containing protein n=1 Tax=Hydrogenovibrio marinus TaxID=28885 RepID=A0A066ZWT3_HYDMR|nr:S8 family serine peptidase [Hydrogenovibrio marinus]KDN96709.1 hypothetical protein EI16_10695 [Hydrogenovibrio marinus]BBN58946.1 hypothetical protein HVMH_0540 [Hydrogenovibrio marinus]